MVKNRAMEIENVIEKIIQYRNVKGFTFENMAAELDITPAAYRKIETGETKLTVDRLFKISKILDTPLSQLLEIGNDVFQQNNNENATGYQQKIEHYHQENKELTDTLVVSLQKEIEHLKGEIQFLRKLAEGK